MWPFVDDPIPPFHGGNKCDAYDWSVFQLTCYLYHANECYFHMLLTILMLIFGFFFNKLVCCMFKKLCRCWRRFGSCFTNNRSPPMPMVLPFKESTDSDIDRFLTHLDLCLKKLNLTHGFYQVEFDPTRQKQSIFDTYRIFAYPSPDLQERLDAAHQNQPPSIDLLATELKDVKLSTTEAQIKIAVDLAIPKDNNIDEPPKLNMIRLPKSPQRRVIFKNEFVPEVRWYTPPRRKPPNTISIDSEVTPSKRLLNWIPCSPKSPP